VSAPPPRIGPLAAVAAVALAAVAAGCGREEEPNLVTGKTLFVSKCGSCHTLGRAGTKGIQGPNLDQAFLVARRDGMTADTVKGIVRKQIANVRRRSIMPRNIVTGTLAEDVAAYVGMVAGQPGKDQGALAQAGQPKVSNKPIQEKGGTLEIDASPTALAFASTKAIGTAGKIEFLMKNPSSTQHDIALKDGGQLGKGPVVGQGGTSRFSATVKAGTYEFFCTVPGHEAAGMKGTLTVK
jgi:plastocyanin